MLAPSVPDDLFFNGVIYTGEGFAEDKPRIVEAMAVAKGKVIAVGTTAEITRLAGPSTRLHDMDTSHTLLFILPGFNDAHTHLGEAGRTKLNVDLRGSESLTEMLSRIEAAAQGGACRALADRWRVGSHAVERESSSDAAGSGQSHWRIIRRSCRGLMDISRLQTRRRWQAAGITAQDADAAGWSDRSRQQRRADGDCSRVCTGTRGQGDSAADS